MVLENCSSTNTADLLMEASLQKLTIMSGKLGFFKAPTATVSESLIHLLITALSNLMKSNDHHHSQFQELLSVG